MKLESVVWCYVHLLPRSSHLSLQVLFQDVNVTSFLNVFLPQLVHVLSPKCSDCSLHFVFISHESLLAALQVCRMHQVLLYLQVKTQRSSFALICQPVLSNMM